MIHITLYTVDCPKCRQLERLLDKVGLSYDVCKDIDVMAALGMREAPVLQVNGRLLHFAEAWKWVKEQEQNKAKIAEVAE